MKKVEFIQTESGKPLFTPNDGFVIFGTLYKGDGEGGLIGDAETVEAALKVPGRAYTNFEFLDALCLDLKVFEDYVARRSPQPRTGRGLSI